MIDNDMTNILKNFTNVGTGEIVDAKTGEAKVSTAATGKNAMKALLEGLDAQQKSVNQMPGAHKMASGYDKKHPADKFLVGGEEGEPEAGQDIVSEAGKLRSVKVNFDDGNSITTDMAANLTDEQIRDYYAVGKRFNLGSGDGGDNVVTVKNVEILEAAVEEDIISKREQPKIQMNKKQSLADLFRSMDETEEGMAARFKKELHDARQSRSELNDSGEFNLAEDPSARDILVLGLKLAKQDNKEWNELKHSQARVYLQRAKKILLKNGKSNLAEAPNLPTNSMTTSNSYSMFSDAKRLMSQGKTIHLIAKESHISDRYKGEIVDYKLTWEDE